MCCSYSHTSCVDKSIYTGTLAIADSRGSPVVQVSPRQQNKLSLIYPQAATWLLQFLLETEKHPINKYISSKMATISLVGILGSHSSLGTRPVTHHVVCGCTAKVVSFHCNLALFARHSCCSAVNVLVLCHCTLCIGSRGTFASAFTRNGSRILLALLGSSKGRPTYCPCVSHGTHSWMCHASVDT